MLQSPGAQGKHCNPHCPRNWHSVNHHYQKPSASPAEILDSTLYVRVLIKQQMKGDSVSSSVAVSSKFGIICYELNLGLAQKKKKKKVNVLFNRSAFSDLSLYGSRG